MTTTTQDIAEAVESADEIRTAYTKIATPGQWIGLAEIRNTLGYCCGYIDAGLRHLATQRGTHLVPVANMKSLTQADRDAALRLGGEDNHAIMIEA